MSSMKMSKDTLSVLKNFSQINSNLLVKPGNRITTVSPAKNIVCEANVSEHFNVQFGIFDLSKFLGTVSLLKMQSLYLVKSQCKFTLTLEQRFHITTQNLVFLRRWIGK